MHQRAGIWRMWRTGAWSTVEQCSAVSAGVCRELDRRVMGASREDVMDAARLMVNAIGKARLSSKRGKV